MALALGVSVQGEARAIEFPNDPKERIARGIASGELTRREAKMLIREQRRIMRMRRVASLDGRITRRELKRIRKAERRASRNIYVQKHD